MEITPALLEEKIRLNIPNVTYVQAIETESCGSKFEITIVSSEFIGKQLLQQHRLVHKAIDEERKTIHALVLKTKTPEQYAKDTASL